MGAGGNDLAGGPYPGGTTGRFAIEVGGTDPDLSGAGADSAQAATGGTGTAAFSLSASNNWRAITVVLSPVTTAFTLTSGHWELRVDATGGGDDLNAIGVRAHDGNSGAGGTEYPVYYDSHTQIGTNDEAGAPSTRNYDLYPWVTAGCTFRESDFDFDTDNGTGGGPSGAEYGRIELVRPNSTTLNPPTFPSPSVLHQALASSTLSGDDDWNTDVVTTWTTDSDSVHYGIWRADAQISEYSGPNSNYANVWFSNFESAGGAPTTNPTANAFRVYLPTDGGGAPAKPYLEQFARWLSGPNPPDTGQTTRMAITVRLVNPTAQSITFSTPNNVVTAPLSGSTKIAYVGSSAGATSGSIVSQPANNATTGSVVWNPGTVAGGTVEILSFEVDVTPTVVNERILILQAPDISPSLAGTRAQYVDETGNTSQPRATYLFGPICEVAVTENAPTRAVVTGLRSEATRDGVVVEWNTATEDGTIGYRLYREQNGAWVEVGDMVRADPRALGGATYRVLDLGADAAGAIRYGLFEVDRLGRTRILGPYDTRPEVSTAEAPEGGSDVSRAAPPASEIERLQVARSSRGTALAEQARLIRPSGATSLALKVRVRDGGLHALSAASVATALGLPEASIRMMFRSNQMRVEQGGSPVATLSANDGSALYFYAEPRDSIYGLDNVYWVRVGAGVRMGKVAVAPAPADADSATSSLERTRVEQDAFPVTVLPVDPTDDYWFWDALEAGIAGADTRIFPAALPAAYSGGAEGSLEVRLHGASETGIAGEHDVEVRFGGELLGEVQFEGLGEGVGTFPLPASLFDRGALEIELHALLVPGVAYSGLFVDGFDVTYARRHEASSDRIELTADGPLVNATRFSGSDIVGFDVTDRRRPKLLGGLATRGGLTGWAAGFRAQPGNRYLLTRLAAARTPLSVEVHSPSDLRDGAGGAEYLVVAPAGLTFAAEDLAELRSAQGLSTRVVSLADVDDEFGHGLASPENLRAFLAWAYEHWATPPRYVALVGDGTLDYRDLMGLGGNLIPALLAQVGDGLYASDSRFGDVDGDGLPEMAVGRIPVLTAAELANYVDRLADLENAPANAAWRRSAVLASDDADPGAEGFRGQSDAAAERLPESFARNQVDLGELPEPDARAQLQADLQAGSALFLFHGHGGLDRLADESLLTIADVPALHNRGKEPVFAALTCSINRFELPGYPSLGEELVRGEDGGAIAVWAPSGLSLGGEAGALSQLFVGSLFRVDSERLGDAILEAERRFGEFGGSGQMLTLYHLLGDPATVLRAPAVDSPGGGGDPQPQE